MRTARTTFLFSLGAMIAASPALAAPHSATIKRDSWGIAHVSGKTDADAVYGMIYAQAEDDFNRIELNYLTNLGRRAEAEGEGLIWQDLRQRLWIDPEALKADYAHSPAWLKALMVGWADGLNQYLADHPAVKPKVITRFEPWMALSFTEGSIGGDIEGVPVSQIEAFYGGQPKALTAEERGLVMSEPLGSNGIAIGASRSASGHPLLLINPHTSFFFRSELQMTSGQGLNAYGAVTWGQFFIYQGFNAKAGWMHTSSGVDVVDEFAETIVRPADGLLAYRYGTKVRPVKLVPITLSYRAADGSIVRRRFTTYATHHGPITAEKDGKWIATALMNRPVAALSQSYLRTKVSDLATFRKVAALQANSSNNTLFADSKGEIAYFHPQFVPLRSAKFDYNKPVDGSDPATDWRGFHSLASLPQVINPRGGTVFNVNDSPWWAAGADSPKQADYPAYVDVAGRVARTTQAISVLGGERRFTLDSLVMAAYDPALPSFSRLIPGLVQAYEQSGDAAGRPERSGAIALLKTWDCKWSASSTATSLAVFWGDALWDKAAAALAARGQNTDALRDENWMANEASHGEKLAALDIAIDRLKTDFGSWQVPWGEINRYQRNDGAVSQVFDDGKPSIAVPYTSARWGSLASFKAKRYPGTKRYYGTHGNSFVAAVEFGPRVRALAVTAGGESGHPASPHFNDQAARYAAGDLRPVWFWPEDLAQHIVASEQICGK